MQIYSLASSIGFETTHGGTYEDPVSKKPRQYDIRSFLIKNNRRLDLAIECKSLKPSFPLVISCIPRIQAECYHEIVCSKKQSGGPLYVQGLNPYETFRINEPDGSNFYPSCEFVGKSTTQIARSEKGEYISGDSEVYDKWTQALGSLSELAADACWYEEASQNSAFLTVLMPILVIPDGTLWVAKYDTYGQLLEKPESTNQTTVFMGRELWRPGTSAYNVSHLHVCTVTGIQCLLKSIESSENTWNQLFPMQTIRKLLVKA